MDQLNPQIPPAEIMNMLQGEKPDFSVYVKRVKPIFQSVILIIVGFLFTAMATGIFFVFWLPVLSGNTTTMTINGRPVEIGPGNIEPLMPTVYTIPFLIVLGIALMIFGIIASLPKPGWIMATKDGLIVVQPKKKNSYSWSQFSGSIYTRGDDTNGKMTLELKTGKTFRDKRGHQSFVPDKVYIFGVQNISQLEQLIKKRISENQEQTPKTV